MAALCTDKSKAMNIQLLKSGENKKKNISRKNNVVPINGESNQIKYKAATIKTFPYLISPYDKAEIRAITLESK